MKNVKTLLCSMALLLGLTGLRAEDDPLPAVIAHVAAHPNGGVPSSFDQASFKTDTRAFPLVYLIPALVG
jgi:hypothetical protein